MRSKTHIPAIIPLPSNIEIREGLFTLAPEAVIVSDQANLGNAAYLRELLAPSTGFQLPVQTEMPGQGQNIQFVLAPDHQVPGPESYRLTVSPTGVRIEAPHPAGVFYGIQSLRQLLPSEVEQRTPGSGVAWQIPCLEITDRPRFSWRGHMLDEGRHFHGKETVRRTLDLMALQKLNVLHWHLTEDQGWRLEIKRYPKLTEVGAWRRGTSPSWTAPADSIPHGGFYTQEEVKEIIAYAAERHITVVPEIEMPGHALAALASYPELSCTGGPFEVACVFGIKEDLFCAGKEEVFTFLQNVLEEVLALFPSEFIHLGGDEAPKRCWQVCPDCQARIRQENLKDAHALQVYFTNRMAAFLDDCGRRLVGWNEILQPGLTERAVPQYWTGKSGPIRQAVLAGRDVIQSPYSHLYLDYSYQQTPLSKAYRYEPVFPGLDEAMAGHILGLEAPLWTEFVPDRTRLDFQTYPRLTAVAETGWTQKERKDFKGFQKRLAVFLRRLDEWGVGYASAEQAEP